MPVRGVLQGCSAGGQEHRGPRTRADAVRGPSRAVQRGVRSTGVHGQGLMRSGVQGCSAGVGGPQTRAEMPVRGVLQGCSAGGQEHRGPQTRADAVRGPSRAVQRGVRSTGVHGRGLMRSGVPVRGPSRAVQRGVRSTGVHGRGLMRSGVQGCSAGGSRDEGWAVVRGLGGRGCQQGSKRGRGGPSP